MWDWGGDFKSYDLIFVGDFQFLTRYYVGYYGGHEKISKNYFLLSYSDSR